MSRLLVLQPNRHNPRMLFLHFWASVRTTTNGPISILVWLAWSQDQYADSHFNTCYVPLTHCSRDLQYPRLPRLVCGEFNCWCTTHQRRQQ